MEHEKLLGWLHVHLAAGVGPKRFRSLIDAFGSPDKIIDASLSQLRSVPHLGPAIAMQIHEGLRSVDPRKELLTAQEAGVQLIAMEDPNYPKLLASCPDPPPILFIKGQLTEQDQVSLAVVGTRRPTHYGSDQAYRLSYLLAQAGVTVVSGLARGIDAQGHRGALLAGGRTIAVLGSGLGQIYPPEHVELADQIVQKGGALISEYPMGFMPQAANFPARNRIVAGMTLGTLVVEAPLQSGALITTSLAIEYNREVFALPGSVDYPSFQGCHQLIKTGRAKLVTCLEDILDELGTVGPLLKEDFDSSEHTPIGQASNLSSVLAESLSETEKKIWDFLEHGSHDIDTICLFCLVSSSQVCAALTTLQLKGLVRVLPGNQYTRR